MLTFKKVGRVVLLSILLTALYLVPPFTFLVGVDMLFDQAVNFNSWNVLYKLIGSIGVIYSIRASLEV